MFHYYIIIKLSLVYTVNCLNILFPFFFSFVVTLVVHKDLYNSILCQPLIFEIIVKIECYDVADDAFDGFCITYNLVKKWRINFKPNFRSTRRHIHTYGQIDFDDSYRRKHNSFDLSKTVRNKVRLMHFNRRKR